MEATLISGAIALLGLIFFVAWVVGGERSAVTEKDKALARAAAAELALAEAIRRATQEAQNAQLLRQELAAARVELAKLNEALTRLAPPAQALADAVRS